MIFLLSQMLVGLACAVVAGGAIGWLLCRTRTGPVVDGLRDTIRRQRAQVEQAQTDVSLISQDFDELKHRSRQQIEELANENRRLPSLHQNLEKSQLLVRQLMQKHEAQLRDLATERDTLRKRLATFGEREEALQKVSAELDRARRRLVTIDIEPPSHGAANTDSVHGGDDNGEAAMPVAAATMPGAAADASDDAVSDSTHDPEPVSGTTHDRSVPPDTAPDGAAMPPTDAEAATGDADRVSSWASARVADISPGPAAIEEADPLLADAIELDELDAEPAPRPPAERDGSPVAGAPIDASQADASLPEKQLFDPVDRHDDLKQIFGIGPMTEKALNQLGITSYSQLADLESHDIESIADALQIFPSRIERDDWAGNARRQLEDVLEEL